MSENKFDFEKSLCELEKIISKLESNDCTLEESISLFEKGVKYTNECREALKTAESKITVLSQVGGEKI